VETNSSSTHTVVRGKRQTGNNNSKSLKAKGGEKKLGDKLLLNMSSNSLTLAVRQGRQSCKQASEQAVHSKTNEQVSGEKYRQTGADISCLVVQP
jgi:hypothetical protein